MWLSRFKNLLLFNDTTLYWPLSCWEQTCFIMLRYLYLMENMIETCLENLYFPYCRSSPLLLPSKFLIFMVIFRPYVTHISYSKNLSWDLWTFIANAWIYIRETLDVDCVERFIDRYSSTNGCIYSSLSLSAGRTNSVLCQYITLLFTL